MIRILAGLLLLASPALAQANDPAAAVHAFYGVYQSRHDNGIPDATGRLRWSVVLSPRLNALLTKAANTQARMGARIKAAGPKAAVMPGLDGDIFTSFFDGATSWKIGACQGDTKLQRCSVALTHAPSRPGDKPANWSDTVVVANGTGGWRVDEVIYDADFAFGNTGTLTSTLRLVASLEP